MNNDNIKNMVESFNSLFSLEHLYLDLYSNYLG